MTGTCFAQAVNTLSDRSPKQRISICFSRREKLQEKAIKRYSIQKKLARENERISTAREGYNVQGEGNPASAIRYQGSCPLQANKDRRGTSTARCSPTKYGGKEGSCESIILRDNNAGIHRISATFGGTNKSHS